MNLWIIVSLKELLFLFGKNLRSRHPSNIGKVNVKDDGKNGHFGKFITKKKYFYVSKEWNTYGFFWKVIVSY